MQKNATEISSYSQDNITALDNAKYSYNATIKMCRVRGFKESKNDLGLVLILQER